MDSYYYLDVTVQIWEADDGSFYYSVIQHFEEDDDQIRAYGQAETELSAKMAARDDFLETLDDPA